MIVRVRENLNATRDGRTDRRVAQYRRQTTSRRTTRGTPRPIPTMASGGAQERLEPTLAMAPEGTGTAVQLTVDEGPLTHPNVTAEKAGKRAAEARKSAQQDMSEKETRCLLCKRSMVLDGRKTFCPRCWAENTKRKPADGAYDVWEPVEPTRSIVLSVIRLMQQEQAKNEQARTTGIVTLIAPQECRRRMQEWYPAILGRYCWEDTRFSDMSGIDREVAGLANFMYRRIQMLVKFRCGKVIIPTESEDCPDACDRETCVRYQTKQFAKCRHTYSCRESRACSWRCALRRALLHIGPGPMASIDQEAVLDTNVTQGGALKRTKLHDVEPKGSTEIKKRGLLVSMPEDVIRRILDYEKVKREERGYDELIGADVTSARYAKGQAESVRNWILKQSDSEVPRATKTACVWFCDSAIEMFRQVHMQGGGRISFSSAEVMRHFTANKRSCCSHVMNTIIRRINAAETTIQAYTSTRNHRRRRAAVIKLSQVCVLWREKAAQELGECVANVSSSQCCEKQCCQACPLGIKFDDLQVRVLTGLEAVYCPQVEVLPEHEYTVDSMTIRQLLRIDNNVWCLRYEEGSAVAVPSGAYRRCHVDGPRHMHMWEQPCALTDDELEEQIQRLRL